MLHYSEDKNRSGQVEVGGKAGVEAGNAELVASVLSWCFKEAGVIRIDQLKHHMVSLVWLFQEMSISCQLDLFAFA